VVKALSIKQPWAWAVIEAGKDVENRRKRTHYRGALFIHACLQDSLDGWHFLDENGFQLPVDPPTGGIIGIVDLVDCVQRYDSPWAVEGYFHWILENPRARRFKPMQGKLGIFDIDLRTSQRQVSR
jgi:hypothetical protein